MRYIAHPITRMSVNTVKRNTATLRRFACIFSTKMRASSTNLTSFNTRKTRSIRSARRTARWTSGLALGMTTAKYVGMIEEASTIPIKLKIYSRGSAMDKRRSEHSMEKRKVKINSIQSNTGPMAF